MTDRTTKEYQDQQTKKALKQRDANVKSNEKDNRKFLQDAYKEAEKTAKKILSK